MPQDSLVYRMSYMVYRKAKNNNSRLKTYSSFFEFDFEFYAMVLHFSLYVLRSLFLYPIYDSVTACLVLYTSSHVTSIENGEYHYPISLCKNEKKSDPECHQQLPPL